MKSAPTPNMHGRVLAAALAALAAPLVIAAQSVSGVQSMPVIGNAQDTRAELIENGTMPDGPPGLPQAERGAAGPLRTDAMNEPRTDPAIRDENPLTKNGLWETLPGNRIARPH